MNDHIVRDFDPNDIPAECFGGEDVFTGYNMMQMKNMKWRNAYLLFYERKVPEDINSEDEPERLAALKSNKSVPLNVHTSSIDDDIEMQTVSSKTLQDKQSSLIALPNEIEEEIIYENQKYWQNRFLFGNEYHEFVYDISLNWNTSNLIPKNYLTKNNDFLLVNQPCPKEYEKNPYILDPLDVKIPIPAEQAKDLELRIFKFACSFYLTIL